MFMKMCTSAFFSGNYKDPATWQWSQVKCERYRHFFPTISSCLRQAVSNSHETTYKGKSKQPLSDYQPVIPEQFTKCWTLSACPLLFFCSLGNVLAGNVPDWPDPSWVIFSAALGRIKVRCCFKLDQPLHRVTNIQRHIL